MLTLIVGIALANSDHLGGTDTQNNEGDMLKLVVLEGEEAAAITGVEFSVYNAGNVGGATLVLYQQVGNGYRLVSSAEATSLPTRGEGSADSGTVAWVLSPGETYAVGAYLEGSWYYYYTQRGSDDPWFGTTAGSLRYAADSVPDSFEADVEAYYYDVVIDSEPADADEDGAIAKEYGGDDCDDTDPDVGAAGVEVPYDGIDQDCDGVDETDVDNDGALAAEVGGDDCDDNDATRAPTRLDRCGDGIDQDCSGKDARCGDTGEGTGDGDGLDVSVKCGCGSEGDAGALALAAGALALAARRRRGLLG